MNLGDIERELVELRKAVETLAAQQAKITALVQTYGSQLGPALDQLQNSTIGKMLFR